MADAVPALLAAGAALIGGCCGTTPAFIRACADVIAGVPR
jgi:methionine synthase I (cobalamin-dependent)